MRPHFLCILSSLFCLILSTQAKPVSIFDGKTLDGWEGNKDTVWRVVDGTIAGGSLQGNPQNEFLTTAKSYKNFRLKLEYKLVGTEGFVNGGVQIRSQRIEDPPNEMIGYQADIGAGYTGCLYDESRRKKMLATADKETVQRLEKPGEWNTYEIVAESGRVQIFLNGTRTIDYTERQSGIQQEGLIGLQIHGNCKAEIFFRNIAIDELAADLVPEQTEILQRFGDPGKSVESVPSFNGDAFTLNNDEVVVFVGQENFVREQKAGELEARLAAGFPKQKPRFRSMAWEGDTVYTQWRDLNFGSWAGQLDAVAAGTIIIQFGQTESFDGVAKIAEFISAYNRLLDEFSTKTKKLVLVSPMPFEKTEDPYLPDLTQKNSDVEAYTKAIKELARQRGAIFVDLYSSLKDGSGSTGSLTDNGLHLNASGLGAVADIIANSLGAAPTHVDLAPIKDAIIEKNRLWFDCWRPANWSFVYGDRVTQLFGKAVGNQPSLRQVFEEHKPLIANWDERIAGLIAGKDIPVNAPERKYEEMESMMTAEQQLSEFTTTEGYEIQLFASEKEGVAKPTQFAWDEKGRLWVACSPSYPHALPGKKPSDYILVLEDTDHDGKADKSWRFAENLTMVQGLEFGQGGLYVCDFDRLLHLKDTDNDGRADVIKTVFAGFGIGDTHQLLNSISWGPDGHLWFTQGLHAYSRVETPWGLAVLEKSGVWRMNPRTQKLESFFNGGKAGHNCWGVAFDDFNQPFHKSGDRPYGYWTSPGLTINPSPDEYHQVGPLFETSPKTTSLDFIGTQALPENIQGTALIGGYFGSVVELHRLIDNGSGFKSEQLPKLLRSKSDAFRPVDVSVGPDGAIYLADWFNPVIGHYQASYADPRRDRKHGRIWRVSAKGFSPVKQPELSKMNAAGLLEQLKSPERWTRYQAKRLLFNKQPEEVIPAADKFAKQLLSDADDKVLMELCGVYASLDTVRPEVVSRLLASKDARIRAYGARIAGSWFKSLPDGAEKLKQAAQDNNARVRLEAVVAASYLKGRQPIEVIAAALKQPTDRFLDYALAQATKGSLPQWKSAFDSGEITFKDAAIQSYLKDVSGGSVAREHPGKAVYDALCLNCHQAGGGGLAGVYPPLADSEWMKGDKTPLIKIVLHGLTGAITVKGATYGVATPIPMPPMGLQDQQIADVLSYLRTSEFNNESPPVTVDEVAKVRSQNSSRSTFWTVEELQKP